MHCNSQHSLKHIISADSRKLTGLVWLISTSISWPVYATIKHIAIGITNGFTWYDTIVFLIKIIQNVFKNIIFDAYEETAIAY